MKKNIVILFSGQGSQKIGMGKDIYDNFDPSRNILNKINSHIGFSLSDKMFNGPDKELTRTSTCQPALYAHGLMCYELIKPTLENFNITATAGLSLGEFTSHCIAGTFDMLTGLDLVKKRGEFMEEATNKIEGSMAAMMRGEEKNIKELVNHCDVDIANINSPGQIIISGKNENIDKAIKLASNFDIPISKKLNVAGAYHSRLMIGAQDKLSKVLNKTIIKSPNISVVSNFNAMEVNSTDEIKKSLISQVSGTVRWSESMQYLINKGESLFIELGPDKTLKGLMKRIDKNVTVLGISDMESFEQAKENLDSLL